MLWWKHAAGCGYGERRDCYAADGRCARLGLSAGLLSVEASGPYAPPIAITLSIHHKESKNTSVVESREC